MAWFDPSFDPKAHHQGRFSLYYITTRYCDCLKATTKHQDCNHQTTKVHPKKRHRVVEVHHNIPSLWTRYPHVLHLHPLRPIFPRNGPINLTFVSAVPSCEVFNSGISVVKTTCSWEPSIPSALILAASSTLSAPNPNPAESELLWNDTEEISGNCSAADGSSHEQDTNRDAHDNMRQHSERKSAIRIAVTVVAPCVVVGAFAWSFGYF